MHKDILIVDDDENMNFALAQTLKKHKFTVDTAGGYLEAREKIEFHNYPLVISDVRMPDGSGIKLVSDIKKKNFDTRVIVITAYGEIKDAVQALKNGASDYIQKPFPAEDILRAVNRYYPENFNKNNISRFYSRNPAVKKLIEQCRIAARSDAPILIQGESGTGKEILGRFIHSQSPRHSHPYIAVNCAAIPENLLENEFFGHEKGAFTGAEKFKPGKFELADRGSLVLDEIGDMPLKLQAKLLRVLQEKEINRLGGKTPIPFDVRLISLTNQNIDKYISENNFREDLYFRLNVVEFRIPPLRERPEDIRFLAGHFLNLSGPPEEKKKRKLHSGAEEKLLDHSWPGNVRELQNVIMKAVIFSGDSLIRPGDIHLRKGTSPSSGNQEIQTVAEMEKGLIFKALEKTEGNKTRAAELLGISPRTLRNKLREYNGG